MGHAGGGGLRRTLSREPTAIQQRYALAEGHVNQLQQQHLLQALHQAKENANSMSARLSQLETYRNELDTRNRALIMLLQSSADKQSALQTKVEKIEGFLWVLFFFVIVLPFVVSGVVASVPASFPRSFSPSLYPSLYPMRNIPVRF